ncbi:MAG: alpha/beta fold hydrolase [Elainella sp. Prado103]|nr:alpha/beta fold hydrolase [Elainella sp. Prado103]
MTIQEHSIVVKGLDWFYREAQPSFASDKLPVVLLHDLPAQSYSWRNVLPALAEQGFRALAPDWIGFGKSATPDRREFNYKSEAYVQALADWLAALEIDRFHLVVQGFLGTFGLQYALQYPQQIDRLAILNVPLTPAGKLPWKIKQMGLPLMGEMMTQDPLLVDRTLEGGGGYRVEDADLDVYRRPFLKSSAAGRSLFVLLQNLKLAPALSAIDVGFKDWQQPILLAWGIRDPWVPVSEAQTFAQQVPNAKLVELAEVGHYPQEDWHEKVNESLLTFLRQQVV